MEYFSPGWLWIIVNSAETPNYIYTGSFPGSSADKEHAFSAGDMGLIARLGRCPGEWTGYSLQYSGLDNSMVCIVHEFVKSGTWLSDLHFRMYTESPCAKSQDRTCLIVGVYSNVSLAHLMGFFKTSPMNVVIVTSMSLVPLTAWYYTSCVLDSYRHVAVFQWFHILTIASSLCVYAKLLQSCLILRNPMDCSPPGSSVHGILPARTLRWVGMPSSMGSFWPRDQTHISHVSCVGRQVLYHQSHLASPVQALRASWLLWWTRSEYGRSLNSATFSLFKGNVFKF